MDYSKTLNLPTTDFPMKANLPEREPEIQKFWNEIDIYARSLEINRRGTFILHDGPPYSNGDVHVGNAMQNKLPKDFIVKYKTMKGYYAPYVPGWDNHGMPIENNVAAEFRKAHKTPTKIELRQRCREYAQHWIDRQRQQYKRLGIRGDWDHPYLTMAKDFEAAEVKLFAELALAGYIYRGLRPIHWCIYDETALAEAEIEYEDHSSPSIYVRFPLRHDPSAVFGDFPAENCYAIIWTTTPWTIPANLALAVHPDFDYVVVESSGNRYLVAEKLLSSVLEAIPVDKHQVVKIVNGRKLEDLVFKHPIYERDSPVVFADYVTMDEGTGIVHTAPGHGREDFMTGQSYNLEVLNPVNEKGIFTSEAGQFEGLHILKEGNSAVIEALRENGSLLSESSVEHSYPHCWRCHNPVIFRTTVQWFLDIDHNNLRQRLLDKLSEISWLPPDAINRMRMLMEAAPDWCLSRQRSWGVGIPVFFCEDCDEEIMTEESLNSVVKLVEAEGSDAWFIKPAEQILPAGFKCPKCGADKFRKEQDILDVWFDSGSTWRTVVEARPELSLPADLYYEGYDQIKAWFGKSLIVSMAATGNPPYKKVAAHGFVVDALGRAMHKSRGNVIKTVDVTQKYGADLLRLAASGFDVFTDARLSDEVMQRTGDAYRRIRNTFRFLLANLNDFDPEKDSVAFADMPEMERWMLHKLQKLVELADAAYENCEFHRIYHQLHNFCAVDLSSLYLDVIKDKMYANSKNCQSRRAAQTVLFEIAHTLVRLIAPILTHTAEEVWKYLPVPNKSISVQLAEFPEPKTEYIDDNLDLIWNRLVDIREEVNKHLETARQSGLIGKPLEAAVKLSVPSDLYDYVSQRAEDLPSFFIVSHASVEKSNNEEIKVDVSPAQGVKCERCWLIKESVGSSQDHPTLCERCAAVVSNL